MVSKAPHAHIKMTNATQSSDDNTSLASSLLSFDVTAPSSHHNEQVRDHMVIHVVFKSYCLVFIIFSKRLTSTMYLKLQRYDQ